MRFIFIVFFLSLSKILSHPHVFVVTSYTVTIEEKKIKDVRIKWIFDEMTSLYYINDFDLNKDGKFDKKERDFITEESFTGIAKYGYMCEIKLNNKKVKIKGKDFLPEIKNNLLVYNYTVEINQPIKSSDLLQVFSIDKENYIAMVLDKKNIKILSDVETSHKIKDINGEFYFGKASIIRIR